MSPVRHDVLVNCFEAKLSGKITKIKEHTHYRFIVSGRMVATTKPESTEGGRRVSILKWPEGALLNLG